MCFYKNQDIDKTLPFPVETLEAQADFPEMGHICCIFPYLRKTNRIPTLLKIYDYID